MLLKLANLYLVEFTCEDLIETKTFYIESDLPRDAVEEFADYLYEEWKEESWVEIPADDDTDYDSLFDCYCEPVDKLERNIAIEYDSSDLMEFFTA